MVVERNVLSARALGYVYATAGDEEEQADSIKHWCMVHHVQLRDTYVDTKQRRLLHKLKRRLVPIINYKGKQQNLNYDYVLVDRPELVPDRKELESYCADYGAQVIYTSRKASAPAALTESPAQATGTGE